MVTPEFTAVDWAHWTPNDNASLLFVIKQDKILLIRKKRGLGAGKINGPGGKFDPGENGESCAIREVEEELMIKVQTPKACGELLFQFQDGYAMHVHVFKSEEYQGTPTETDEAIPLWYSVDNIPFNEMWEDDPLWFPKMLNNQFFRGRFLFNGDKMLGYQFD